MFVLVWKATENNTAISTVFSSEKEMVEDLQNTKLRLMPDYIIAVDETKTHSWKDFV